MSGLATLGFLLFKNSAREIILLSEKQVAHAGELVDIKFEAFLDNVRRDIRYLAQSPFLSDYLDAKVQNGYSRKKELLSEEYLALLYSKPDYAQIRFIGEQGREVIRAERLDRETFLVSDSSLQDKGNRNYFSETIRLPKDSIYFSPVDLNKEYGQITDPAIPTLRAASPIYHRGKISGIVVINVDLRNLFNELNLLAGPHIDLKLVNSDGHFLIHPDTRQTFTFEYGKGPQFKQDFGISLEQALANSILENNAVMRDKGFLYALNPLDYPRNDYNLYVGVVADEEEILQSFYTWRKQSQQITFLLALLILVLAFIYMRRQARELKDITETMTDFPQNLMPAKLPINRNDEIGQLAKSFEKMSLLISGNLIALRKAKEESEQAYLEKEAFLENMSHEIRNPIHSIIGMTHLLEKNNPAKHQLAFIEALKFNSKNLLSLVNDILDYKKLSSGGITIQPEWFPIGRFVNELANSLRFSAVSKKVKLIEEMDEALEQILVFTDPLRLTQVVNNLMVNAIKFTGEGGEVRIATKVLEQNAGNWVLRFSVFDNGMGIEEELINKIIERYYTHGDNTHDTAPKGAGLGLPIVIQLLKLFSSRLQIESAPGKGSHFYFDLALPVREQILSNGASATGIVPGLLGNADILAIDDDEQVLLLYRHIFENAASLQAISTVQELERLPENSADIIITDVHFGRTEIYDFLQKLKRISRPGGLLYIVTGIDINKDKQRALSVARKVFRKPINPADIVFRISADHAASRFGIPDVSSILHDYDKDPVKFSNAMDLLIVEWEKMSSEIENAVLEADREKFDALKHKLITSVRRLHLSKFETLLNRPFYEEEPSPELASRIKLAMEYYLWSLRKKIKSF